MCFKGDVPPPTSILETVMRRALAVAALLASFTALPLHAQAPATLTGDLIKDINDVEAKLVGLANALSDEQYKWRPAEGVRSVHEVLMHVAADNYFIPAAMGVPAPAATKITATDYSAVQAFEQQKPDKATTIAELKASFAHVKNALAGVPEARMSESLKVFGQDFTVRGFMVLTTTHLHEHLGQMIAYARVNGVKPPWSR
jgi:uncharacterized damage-inducible protein DinB